MKQGKLTGAQIFVESLLAEGVEMIFGYPGGAVLPLYDVLYDSKLRHYRVRHEQGAVHMADGYSRATGKCGVCLVTSGPGATNTVTGIANAYMDSIPIIVFTGQVNVSLIGNDAFQEADIIGITRPCTKHSFLVRDTNDLAMTIKKAFYIATTGKPGPVVIDLPKDILGEAVPFEYPKSVSIRSYNPNVEGHPAQVKKAFTAMREAKKPVFYIGGGLISANGSKELFSIATATHIPVTTTLMAMGAFPSDNSLSLGMLGMHGTYTANMVMHQSDLIISLGSRFDDRVTGKLDEFAPNAKIIHVDIDPGSIGKNVAVDIPVVGDLGDVLKKLNAHVKKEKTDWIGKHAEWLKAIEGWKNAHPLKYEKSDTKIKPQYVIERIDELTRKQDPIYTTEVGQSQMWAAQFINFQNPRTFITSGGLGTMGFGFPAALGAQAAFPDRLVIDIAGDGSIQMNIQELGTAIENGLNTKVAILNNNSLGMVRQWQKFFFNERYSSSIMPSYPDFVKLAESYGAVGLRAEKPSDVDPVIKEALAVKKPVLMDFIVDPEENVFPMVPAGKTIKDIMLA
ncbi:MAG: biosynthetic-type acetolactate synthase large subunit [Nitrospinota bacterium]|nr:biosynthetic-type acetolactate synthase large subunit [Nitrospinota bacterium]